MTAVPPDASTTPSRISCEFWKISTSLRYVGLSASSALAAKMLMYGTAFGSDGSSWAIASSAVRPASSRKSLLTIAAATSGSEVAVNAASSASTLTFEFASSMSATVEKIEPPSSSSMSPADCSTSRPRAWLLSSLGTATVEPSGMSSTESYWVEYRPSG